MRDSNFIPFLQSELSNDIPSSLISPFSNNTHPLAKIASNKLQAYITLIAKTNANFELNHGNDTKKIGKMFGVLIVKNQKGEIGYLQAFSGKLGDSNHHKNFVPPIFDLLNEDNYFNIGMTEITVLTNEINDYKTSTAYLESSAAFNTIRKFENDTIYELRKQRAINKQNRNQKRQKGLETMSEPEFQQLDIEITKERIEDKTNYKLVMLKCKTNLKNADIEFEKTNGKLIAMKKFRKSKSINLQNQLFTEYTFVNQKNETMLLSEIFKDLDVAKMPAGAGECSAPKLFQYAFKNNYTPLALAEFWWGKSPKSENKIHQGFYPPCKEKCVPILGFMLS